MKSTDLEPGGLGSNPAGHVILGKSLAPLSYGSPVCSIRIITKLTLGVFRQKKLIHAELSGMWQAAAEC